MIGIEFGWVSMTSLGYDGTLIRANNSRQASRTPDRLRQLKMATDEAQEIYKTRQHAGERPFAMMKWFFRADQFLTRGLDRVSQEYDWLSAGFNLHRLLSLIRHSLICDRRGPPRPKAIALYPSLSPLRN